MLPLQYAVVGRKQLLSADSSQNRHTHGNTSLKHTQICGHTMKNNFRSLE
jgi:hypothetical protein